RMTGQDAAPVLSNVAATASYTGVDSNPASSRPVTRRVGLQVSDVDNQTLASAKVSISSATFFTGDVLSANVTGTSITASYANGGLTLTGTDTLAHYQQVLDSVTYSSTSSNPTNFGNDPSRTISWVVNDGARDSAAQTTTLSITGQDAAPVLSNVAATASYTGVDSNPASSTPVTLSSALQVSDVDNHSLHSPTVSISSATFFAGDVLSANVTGTSITASYANGVLTLTGTDTLAHYQQVLASATLFPYTTLFRSFGNDPSRTISWVVNDGARDSAA